MKIHFSIPNEPRKIPAIPPEDYSGSISKWISRMIDKNLMEEDGFYGDVLVSERQYKSLLEYCEK